MYCANVCQAGEEVTTILGSLPNTRLQSLTETLLVRLTVAWLQIRQGKYFPFRPRSSDLPRAEGTVHS